jgi:hypothetical protein
LVLTRGTHILARTFLALALVVAQVLAQAHGLSHVRFDPLHAPGSQNLPCSECLLGAPLLSAASTPALSTDFGCPAMEAATEPDSPLLDTRARHRRFYSRAPPL